MSFCHILFIFYEYIFLIWNDRFQMVDFRVPKSVRKEAQAYLIEKGEAA